LTSKKRAERKEGGKESAGVESEKAAELDSALVSKVLNYLKEHGKASPPQIARDLNLKTSTIVRILMELKKSDRVRRID